MATDRPEPLSIARAEEEGDCRLIPVKDLLVEALREMEKEGDYPINKATGAILIFVDDSDDIVSGHSLRVAGLIRSQIYWWCNVAAAEALDEFRGKE